jgi:predicted HAD superfamily Cof-like phosphohydrolase
MADIDTESHIRHMAEIWAGGAGIKVAQQNVADFHRALDVPAPLEPTPLGNRHSLRTALINEEAKEFAEAAELGDTVEMIDALCDLMYVTLGAGVEMGVDLAPFWREVQAANMRKVGGEVRPDGKRLKPPGWTPPDHRRVWSETYGDLPIPEGR